MTEMQVYGLAAFCLVGMFLCIGVVLAMAREVSKVRAKNWEMYKYQMHLKASAGAMVQIMEQWIDKQPKPWRMDRSYPVDGPLARAIHIQHIRLEHMLSSQWDQPIADDVKASTDHVPQVQSDTPAPSGGRSVL